MAGKLHEWMKMSLLSVVALLPFSWGSGFMIPSAMVLNPQCAFGARLVRKSERFPQTRGSFGVSRIRRRSNAIAYAQCS